MDSDISLGILYMFAAVAIIAALGLTIYFIFKSSSSRNMSPQDSDKPARVKE